MGGKIVDLGNGKGNDPQSTIGGKLRASVRGKANNNEMLEAEVEEYFVDQVAKAGGGTRKIQYVGRRGASDQFTVFPFNRIFLCELKRPRGSRISIHQHADAAWLRAMGVRKEYLYTKRDVDCFMRRIGSIAARTVHGDACDCDRCIPL